MGDTEPKAKLMKKFNHHHRIHTSAHRQQGSFISEIDAVLPEQCFDFMKEVYGHFCFLAETQ